MEYGKHLFSQHVREKYFQIMIEPLVLPLMESIKSDKKLDSEEQLLITGMIAKNEWAYKRLYQLYSANLLGVILQIVSHQEIAEDLLQESFSKIFTNICGYDERKGRLFTWMLNICRNTAIDHLRKISTRNLCRTFELDMVLPDVENQFSHSIFTDRIGLASIISTLSEKQKSIIRLVYYQGYSHEEAAKELQLPLGSLKTALRLGIISLRKFFIENEKSA